MSVRRVSAFGDIIWQGSTEPVELQLSAVGKSNKIHRWVVANEYVCNRLAMLAGVPVAPGALVKTAPTEHAPDGLLWASLNVFPEGERPGHPTAGMLATQQASCTAAVVFDAWTLNEDRTLENVLYAPDVDVSFTLIDHDGALMANDRDVTAGQYADRSRIGGQLHGHVQSGRELAMFVDYIRDIPRQAISRVLGSAVDARLITREEEAALYTFLDLRRERLLQLIRQDWEEGKCLPNIDEVVMA